MSTIQTQGTMVHLQSGLNIASGIQRDTQESAFTSGVVDVTTVGESIALGDVIVPKQVFLKLVAGDAVKIGFDGVSYPLRLNVENESMILALDVESGSYEKSRITTINDTEGGLSGTWFDMADVNGPVRVWMRIPTPIAANGTIHYLFPAVDDVVYVAGAGFTKVATTPTPAAGTYSDIDQLAAAIDALPDVSATASGDYITIVAATPGASGNSIAMSFGFPKNGTMELSNDYLWGGYDASTSPPTPSGGRLIPVNFGPNDASVSIAASLIAAMDADAQYTAITAGPDTVDVHDISPELRDPITDGASATGFTFSRSLNVTVIPGVHLLSLGTSQVAMAIAPI